MSATRLNLGEQIAYACWCANLYGPRPRGVRQRAYRFFSQWSELQAASKVRKRKALR